MKTVGLVVIDQNRLQILGEFYVGALWCSMEIPNEASILLDKMMDYEVVPNAFAPSSFLSELIAVIVYHENCNYFNLYFNAGPSVQRSVIQIEHKELVKELYRTIIEFDPRWESSYEITVESSPTERLRVHAAWQDGIELLTVTVSRRFRSAISKVLWIGEPYVVITPKKESIADWIEGRFQPGIVETLQIVDGSAGCRTESG